ncbi:MAG: hypothetical protein ABIE22_03160 [archaeon]
MSKKWKGCIVKESLEDSSILDKLETLKIREDSDEESSWHIYDSLVTESEINEIHKQLKQSWYVHFWKDGEMIVLFKGKKFKVDPNNKETWKEAINYGLSINIPLEQLDFLMEF